MYSYTNCPVCNNTKFKSFISCKDHTVSKETFTIVECESCGLKFTNPIPNPDQLGNYYKSEDYISHSNTKKGIISRLYHIVRSYTLKKKVNLIASYVSRGTILDYGCGTGMFLKVCKDSGWKTLGMEPDQGARQLASELGLNTYENINEITTALKESKVEAITLWHVLEHVTDLSTSLAFFHECLKSDGILVIAVPNHKSYDASHYREFWAAYDVPRHLYHFEKETIKTLLSNNRFNLIETRPMKFDSFYVSMLSEKYKTGSILYLNAFFNGLKSNLSAKDSAGYSSTIYIFRKQ